MSNPSNQILDLVEKLSFTFTVSGESAFGSLGDTLVTMTILSHEPLGLLFALNINRAIGELPFSTVDMADWKSATTKISVEYGRVWLSLYDVTDRTNEEIIALLKQLDAAIHSAGMAVGPGCVQCGCLDQANVIHAEGRTTRICPKCLEAAIADKHQQDAQLNRTNLSAFMALPTVVLFSASCWSLAWLLADALVAWLRIRIVEINQLTVLVLLGLYATIGAAVGVPLGKMLRRSGAVRFAPIPLSCLIVLATVVAGEIGYVMLLIFWNAGIFNLTAALQLLGPILTSYTGFWIANKLFCMAAVSAFCISFASETKATSLKI